MFEKPSIGIAKSFYKFTEVDYSDLLDECFGYTPLLGLGGSEKTENLEKVNPKVHIELIAQLVGRIE